VKIVGRKFESLESEQQQTTGTALGQAQEQPSAGTA
jgi:hypothetical protein